MRRRTWLRVSALLVLWALTLWALALFLALGVASLLIGTPTQAVVWVSSVCTNSIALVLGSVATAKQLCIEPEVPATTTIVWVRLTLAVLQVMAASPALLAIKFGVLVGLPSAWLLVTPALVAVGVSAWNLARSTSESTAARVLTAIGFAAVITGELVVFMT